MLVGLGGCGPPIDSIDSPSLDAEIASLRDARLSALTPEEVAEAFALGTRATKVQREMLESELVGSVVEWDLTVYEVSYEDGAYKVLSRAIPIESEEAAPLLRVAAFVYPEGEADHELLRTVQTDEVIRVRGRVREIQLRTVLVVWPGLVVGTRSPTTI